MIEFLRPGFLGALPLAAIPAALHFWGMARARPTPFTALDLLREAAQTRFAAEKIRRWLLLTARTLLLIALVLFLAQPRFQGALGSAPQRGVLLVDASYSLQSFQSGETAFDRAKHMARALINGRNKKDRWGLVVFSDRVETSISPDADPALVLRELESMRPTFRGTSYALGFAEAEKWVKKSGPVVLFSDLAAHGLLQEKRAKPLDVTSVVAVEVVSRRPNAAVGGLRPSGVGDQRQAEILGWGETSQRTWSLRHEGRWEARGPVRWESGRGLASFRVGAGVMELALDPDSLPADDRWFFVNQTDRPVSVLLVNGAPSLSPVGDETYFLRPVLEGLSSLGVTGRIASLGDLSTFPFADTRVVALLNPPPLSPSVIDRLVSFVEGGGGLWVTAGDRGGVLPLGDLSPLSNPSTRPMDEDLEWSGPDIFADVKELLWNRVHVDRVLSGTPRSGAQVLVRSLQTKSPLLTVGSRGRGRVALWGSSIDRDWTNFPAKPAFPILAGRLLSWLSGRPTEGGASSFFVGDVIERTGAEDRPFSIRRPDQRLDRMVRSGEGWRYDKTDIPGIYEISGSGIEPVGVNVRAEKEGDLTRLSPEALKNQLGGLPLQFMNADRTRINDILIALHGRDLTPILARWLFAFLFIESILLMSRRK